MRRGILGLTVISAGVGAALPFRNEAVRAPVDAREAGEVSAGAMPRNELTLQLTIPTAATMIAEQQPASVLPDAKPLPRPQEVRRQDLQAPPDVSSTFEPLVEAFPVATQERTPLAIADQPERLHRIADGDTLEGMAERYLGDRSNWRRIFEANHTALTDPDILPIGAEIKIPRNAKASTDNDVDDLVPIPAGLLNRGQ